MQIYQFKRFEPQNRSVIYLNKMKYKGFIQDTKNTKFFGKIRDSVFRLHSSPLSSFTLTIARTILANVYLRESNKAFMEY